MLRKSGVYSKVYICTYVFMHDENKKIELGQE